MFTLSISEENLKKLDKIAQTFGTLEEKIVQEALRKAIQVVKKEDKKAILERYSVEKQEIAGANLKTKTTKTEAMLLGSTKRKKLHSFEISKRTPGRSKEYIKTQIVKKKSSIAWKTLFWAYWKQGQPKLMFRVRKDRNKIAIASSISTRNMGLQLDETILFEKVQKVFTEVLEQRIDEVWE